MRFRPASFSLYPRACAALDSRRTVDPVSPRAYRRLVGFTLVLAVLTASPRPNGSGAGALWIATVPRAAATTGAPVQAPPQAPPGTAAPAEVVQQLQSQVATAVQQFERRDTEGVLRHVSEQYRTGPLTKPSLRAHLQAMFAVYDAMKVRVRIDTVRMVGEHAWVYSSGELSGHFAWLDHWVPVLSWQRELEVARREDGVWRLFGYQRLRVGQRAAASARSNSNSSPRSYRSSPDPPEADCAAP